VSSRLSFRLEVDWRPSHDCGAEFHDLFLNAFTRHGVSTPSTGRPHPVYDQHVWSWPPTRQTPWCVVGGGGAASSCPQRTVTVRAPHELEALVETPPGTNAVLAPSLHASLRLCHPSVLKVLRISCEEVQRTKSAFYRSLVPSFTVQALADTLWSQHVWGNPVVAVWIGARSQTAAADAVTTGPIVQVSV